MVVRTATALLFLVALAGCDSAETGDPSVAGKWFVSGDYTTVFELSQDGHIISGSMYIEEFHTEGGGKSSVEGEYDYPDISFEYSGPLNGGFEGTVAESGDLIRGEFRGGGPTSLTRR